ncbi:MAG: nuclear transport factor 2 family protein [Pseudonocardia sp.]|nr:nuclear transport factor 2 family protein [Pseudonocardia sp.]
MSVRQLAEGYGRDSRNRLAEAAEPSVDGARAALESFYYALNNRDAQTLQLVWSDHPLAQLNNPLGGILRGGDSISRLYREVLTGSVRVWVGFADIVEYAGGDHVVFAGRETGEYTDPAGLVAPLAIRTSRYFRYQEGRWRQYHHHGSIDEPEMLAAYRHAVFG